MFERTQWTRRAITFTVRANDHQMGAIATEVEAVRDQAPYIAQVVDCLIRVDIERQSDSWPERLSV